MTKDYFLTKEVAGLLNTPHWKVSRCATKLKLGKIIAGRRFLEEADIELIKEKIKPKYTTCIICGKKGIKKYCSKKCLREFHRQEHYKKKVSCGICGKITHRKYCCDTHKKIALKKTRKGINL